MKITWQFNLRRVAAILLANRGMRLQKSGRSRALLAAGLSALGLLVGLAGGMAWARVSPINQIGRQVQKGNMLIVLDTSGSMTGVPGELFDTATELGVDCELGQNCRVVDTTGRCETAQSPIIDPQTNMITGWQRRICANDAACRSGRCRDGGDPCMADADCPTSGSTCSATGEPCQYNSDCMPQFAQCSAGVGMCSSVNPTCPPAGECEFGGATCTNPGGACGTSVCANNPSQNCTTDLDCAGAAPQPPAAGLVFYYRLDASSGTTATDSSPNNLHGTVTGGAWQPTGGKVDGAWQCGWGDRISVPNGAPLNSANTNNQVSVSAWIRPTESLWNHVISR